MLLKDAHLKAVSIFKMFASALKSFDPPRGSPRRAALATAKCGYFALVSGVYGFDPLTPGVFLGSAARTPEPVVDLTLFASTAESWGVFNLGWPIAADGLSSAWAIDAPANDAPANKAATAATAIKVFIRFLR